MLYFFCKICILLSNFAIDRGGDNDFQLDNTLEGIEITAPAAPETTTNDSLK